MKLWSFAIVLAIVVVASACGSASGTSDGTSPATRDGVITVKMFDNSFKPADITVAAGTRVTFHLPNVGILPHNMHIASERGIYRESPWMSPTINGGQTTELVWDVPEAAGTYKFRCDVHEVEMVGTLTVE